MLSRRSLFAIPAALAALTGTTTATTSPAMSRESAFALVKGRIDEVLAPHEPPFPKWGEIPDVMQEWIYFYKGGKGVPFATPDLYVEHRIKTFFYNGRVSDLIRHGKLVNDQGRLAHSAQLLLPGMFPLELHQFDRVFTDALLMLKPK